MLTMIVQLCAVLFALSSLQATDEFTYQQYIGCAFNQQGPVGRFWRYGFNTKDIMHVDLGKEAVVATSDEGNFMAEERQSKLYFQRKEFRLNKICSAVQTVFSQSNNSLSTAAKPTARVSLEEIMGQEYLMCSVRGFYPNVIRVRWVYKGKIVYFGSTTTGLLPHRDGTFQMTSYLTVGNRTLQNIVCEIEHISIEGTLKATLEDEYLNIGLLVGIAFASFLLACLIPLAITGLKYYVKKKGTQSSVGDSLDRSSDNCDIHASVSLMDLDRENQQS